MANKTVIDAAKAKEMTEDEMERLLSQAGINGPQRFEINVQDPVDEPNDGVYLEVIVLDDLEAAVRSCGPSEEAERSLVPVSDVYEIYHILVDQVEDLLSEEGN